MRSGAETLAPSPTDGGEPGEQLPDAARRQCVGRRLSQALAEVEAGSWAPSPPARAHRLIRAERRQGRGPPDVALAATRTARLSEATEAQPLEARAMREATGAVGQA